MVRGLQLNLLQGVSFSSLRPPLPAYPCTAVCGINQYSRSEALDWWKTMPFALIVKIACSMLHKTSVEHWMQGGTTALSALSRLEALRLYELENLDEGTFVTAASTLTKCRSPSMPPPLARSRADAGMPSAWWKGHTFGLASCTIYVGKVDTVRLYPAWMQCTHTKM